MASDFPSAFYAGAGSGVKRCGGCGGVADFGIVRSGGYGTGQFIIGRRCCHPSCSSALVPCRRDRHLTHENRLPEGTPSGPTGVNASFATRCARGFPAATGAISLLPKVLRLSGAFGPSRPNELWDVGQNDSTRDRTAAHGGATSPHETYTSPRGSAAPHPSCSSSRLRYSNQRSGIVPVSLLLVVCPVARAAAIALLDEQR